MNKEQDIIFGGCNKHPNFPMVKCPICEVEKEMDILEKRIEAGDFVLRQSKKQMSNLKTHKKELSRLRFQIEAAPNECE